MIKGPRAAGLTSGGVIFFQLMPARTAIAAPTRTAPAVKAAHRSGRGAALAQAIDRVGEGGRSRQYDYDSAATPAVKERHNHAQHNIRRLAYMHEEQRKRAEENYFH